MVHPIQNVIVLQMDMNLTGKGKVTNQGEEKIRMSEASIIIAPGLVNAVVVETEIVDHQDMKNDTINIQRNKAMERVTALRKTICMKTK